MTGEPVDPRFVIGYEGRCIGFCCAKCPAVFWANPAQYLNKIGK